MTFRIYMSCTRKEKKNGKNNKAGQREANSIHVHKIINVRKVVDGL